jgi:hypothetical protein
MFADGMLPIASEPAFSPAASSAFASKRPTDIPPILLNKPGKEGNLQIVRTGFCGDCNEIKSVTRRSQQSHFHF